MVNGIAASTHHQYRGVEPAVELRDTTVTPFSQQTSTQDKNHGEEQMGNQRVKEPQSCVSNRKTTNDTGGHDKSTHREKKNG
jgi:hypothetical protein